MFINFTIPPISAGIFGGLLLLFFLPILIACVVGLVIISIPVYQRCKLSCQLAKPYHLRDHAWIEKYYKGQEASRIAQEKQRQLQQQASNDDDWDDDDKRRRDSNDFVAMWYAAEEYENDQYYYGDR
ncbi:MAG: hypothetical protein ACOX2M_03555 [Fastidiosipilaceae bacterium]|jgi:hypothetical protein